MDQAVAARVDAHLAEIEELLLRQTQLVDMVALDLSPDSA
jgi:hypothetical protein